MQKAYFAAGCFWGTEALFRQIDGVSDVSVGYINGKTEDPTYNEVCGGETGYAEGVEIDFDETLVRYETLLTLFWKNHQPTSKNKQGPDSGSQYRAAIFYLNEEQKNLALLSKEALAKSGKYSDPVVTDVEAFHTFYRAEEYHQRYFEKHGKVCHFNHSSE